MRDILSYQKVNGIRMKNLIVPQTKEELKHKNNPALMQKHGLGEEENYSQFIDPFGTYATPYQTSGNDVYQRELLERALVIAEKVGYRV